MLSHCRAPMRETTETTTLKPERIVLCIDVSEETGSCWNNNPNPNLKTTTPPYPTRLDVVKDGLQGFVVRKANLTRGVRHKFAICLLGGVDEVDWVLNFSDDLDEIQDVLRGIDTRKGNESSMTFDLSVLLSTLRKKVLNPRINAVDDGGIVRAILVYGRSYMLPKLAVPSALDILRNEDMYCDLLYIHPKVDDAEGSLCQQVRLNLNIRLTRTAFSQPCSLSLSLWII